MITLLVVALPKSLPTVNQCTAVLLTSPAGICAAVSAVRGDEVIQLGVRGWGIAELESLLCLAVGCSDLGLFAPSLCFQRYLSLRQKKKGRFHMEGDCEMLLFLDCCFERGRKQLSEFDSDL